MALQKSLALPTTVTGNYHPIGQFEVRRGTPGSVVVHINQHVDKAARDANAQPLMERAFSVPLADLNQATVNAFMGELWKHANLAIDAAVEGDALFDLQGATDVFEGGQTPTP